MSEEDYHASTRGDADVARSATPIATPLARARAHALARWIATHEGRLALDDAYRWLTEDGGGAPRADWMRDDVTHALDMLADDRLIDFELGDLGIIYVVMIGVHADA